MAPRIFDGKARFPHAAQLMNRLASGETYGALAARTNPNQLCSRQNKDDGILPSSHN
jgi:hypothetical protein